MFTNVTSVMKAKILCAETLAGNIVVAIEFQIVKGSGDAEPAGHGSGLDAGNAGVADDDHIAATHGTADQNDF